MTRPSGASTQLEKINFHFNVEALARQWVPPPPAPTSRRTPAVVAAAKGIAAVWGELTGSKARSWALAHELWLTLKDEPTVWYKPGKKKDWICVKVSALEEVQRAGDVVILKYSLDRAPWQGMLAIHALKEPEMFEVTVLELMAKGKDAAEDACQGPSEEMDAVQFASMGPLHRHWAVRPPRLPAGPSIIATQPYNLAGSLSASWPQPSQYPGASLSAYAAAQQGYGYQPHPAAQQPQPQQGYEERTLAPAAHAPQPYPTHPQPAAAAPTYVAPAHPQPIEPAYAAPQPAQGQNIAHAPAAQQGSVVAYQSRDPPVSRTQQQPPRPIYRPSNAGLFTNPMYAEGSQVLRLPSSPPPLVAPKANNPPTQYIIAHTTAPPDTVQPGRSVSARRAGAQQVDAGVVVVSAGTSPRGGVAAAVAAAPAAHAKGAVPAGKPPPSQRARAAADALEGKAPRGQPQQEAAQRATAGTQRTRNRVRM